MVTPLYFKNMKSKLLYLLFVIPFFIVGCAGQNAKKTATDYLKKQMKDPSSFKVEDIDIVLDTIPLFLNKHLLSISEEVSKAMDEKERYEHRDSYYWRDEKERASRKLSNAILSLAEEYQNLKKKEQPVQYMVLINCSGNNSYGSTVSSKYIVIVDKDDTDNVLGVYRLDSDFAKRVVTSYLMTGQGKLKENEFGKINTEGMTQVEKFIFAD